jgi:branched-chain amino acid transport system permease protein
MDIMQAVASGIVMGSIYGLTALGLTLIFGVMKVINFAHGSMLMVSMFMTYWLLKFTHMNPYLSLFVIVPLMFFIGFYIQRFLILPIFRAEREVREPISVILVTSGLWIFLDAMALLLFGAFYRTIKTSVSGKTLIFGDGDLILIQARLYGFVITIIVALILWMFLKKTRTGRAIRAVGQDREAAQLMGIDSEFIYNFAFGLGIALVAVAGVVLVPFYYVHPTVGVVFDIRAFIIVVLGGLGSIPGALLGGLIIGFIEAVGAQYMTATWTEGLIYLIFLVVLFLKPSGLFGQRQEW